MKGFVIGFLVAWIGLDFAAVIFNPPTGICATLNSHKVLMWQAPGAYLACFIKGSF